MTASELLNLTSYLVGAALSLGTARIPWLADHFGPLDNATKLFIILVASLLSAIGLALLSCAVALAWLPCDTSLPGNILLSAFHVFIASQAAYLAGVKPFKPSNEPPQ